MNYLAHAYLSFRQPGILVGNMISDFVKGKKQYDYPAAIQKGIRLHRAIDVFTDTHPLTSEAKKIFKPAVGLYAGAFLDIVYDHFLARDNQIFTEQELTSFTGEVYRQLTAEQAVFPEKFARMFPYMQTQNWLYHYRNREGIEKSFGGLVRRAAYLTDSTKAFEAFTGNYDALNGYYARFFPELQAYASSQFAELVNQ